MTVLGKIMQHGVRRDKDVVMADAQPINILVVGECGDGKTTLIARFRDPAKSAQPAIGRNPRGVTKEIMMYPCLDLDGVRTNLIDTPGVGDMDCSVIQLISMIEAFLTEGMVPGGIRAVVVTNPVPDGRVKLGAQIVQAVVDKGFVAAHGDDKYANIILCGTKVDRADPEGIAIFMEGSEGIPSDDYSQLLDAIRNLPCTSIAFQKPESRVMAQALASKLGMEPEEFESQMDGMHAMVQARRRSLQCHT
eukprot:Skav227046  [mRNA]  locus=scaffold72:638890:641028:- [translate_table: standard]